MSIKQQGQIEELRDRVERLERVINRAGLEVRTVAGVPDPDTLPPPKKNRNKNTEGS